jgi:ABC-2 type transport system permease protein
MMTLQKQCIGLYTLIRRELVRMFRIFIQVFLPPLVTTLLYFLIFGTVMGGYIGAIQGTSYAKFIAPGLVMMTVITNSYANVSTSLFSIRFQRNIEELLVSPMHYSLLLLGFTFGGILRGVIVAILVFFVAYFFIDIDIKSLPMTLLIVILVAGLFSLAGFTNAILAKNFEDIAIVPTFILAPLTYLGGVFYSTDMLSPFWQHVSYFNPILYMVNALRHVMLGHREVNMALAMTVISALLLGLTLLNLWLLKKGVGIRE